MDAKERQRIRELIEAHKERKHGREVQLARLGISADPIINTEIAEIDAAIQKLEQQLKNSVEHQASTPLIRSKTQIERPSSFTVVEQTSPIPPPSRRITPVHYEPISATKSRSYFNRGRLFVIFLAAVFMIALILLLSSPSRPITNSWSKFADSTSTVIITNTPAPSFGVGSTWSTGIGTLALRNSVLVSDKLQLSWQFTNTTSESITLPVSYFRIGAQDSKGKMLAVTFFCERNSNCMANHVIVSGLTTNYTNEITLSRTPEQSIFVNLQSEAGETSKWVISISNK